MQLGRRTLGVVTALFLVGSVPAGNLGHSKHQLEAEAVVAAAFAAMTDVDSYRLTTRRTSSMGKAPSWVLDKGFVDVRGGRALFVHDDGRETRVSDGVVYSEVGPSTADEVDTAWIAFPVPHSGVGSATDAGWASFDPERTRPIFVARGRVGDVATRRYRLAAAEDDQEVRLTTGPSGEVAVREPAEVERELWIDNDLMVRRQRIVTTTITDEVTMTVTETHHYSQFGVKVPTIAPPADQYVTHFDSFQAWVDAVTGRDPSSHTDSDGRTPIPPAARADYCAAVTHLETARDHSQIAAARGKYETALARLNAARAATGSATPSERAASIRLTTMVSATKEAMTALVRGDHDARLAAESQIQHAVRRFASCSEPP